MWKKPPEIVIEVGSGGEGRSGWLWFILKSPSVRVPPSWGMFILFLIAPDRLEFGGICAKREGGENNCKYLRGKSGKELWGVGSYP